MKISNIIIKERIRDDIGSLYRLKESMKNNGLINPITLSETHELIAGYRRLQSAIDLGWTEIECNILHAETELDKLEIEAAENITRKDFNDQEIIKLDKRRTYLSATGFTKFILFLKQCLIFVKNWIKKVFSRKSNY